MKAVLAVLLLAAALAGLTLPIYWRVIPSDPTDPSRWRRIAIAVGSELMMMCCLIAAELISMIAGWAGPDHARGALAGGIGALVGAALVHAWHEYHREQPPPRESDPLQ